jgi:radical SAM protein with 4Fe4S-binding SPASM domain
MESALRGLRNLLNAEANLTVFVVPMRQNSHEIPSLVEQMSEEGVEDVRILLPSPTGRAFSRFAELELTDEQVLSLRKELARVQAERRIHLKAGFSTRLDFPDIEILKGHEQCYAAEDRVHVDAFGNVYACTASSGRRVFSAGNLQVPACTLTEIWRFSPFFQFLRRFHSNPSKKCQSCARFGNCMSGCRVRMSYKYGDATIADPLCRGPY